MHHWCISNLVIVAQIYDELLHGQPNFQEFWVKMAKMTLKVKANDQIPAESIPGYMFSANLVILAQIYDELPCG